MLIAIREPDQRPSHLLGWKRIFYRSESNVLDILIVLRHLLLVVPIRSRHDRGSAIRIVDLIRGGVVVIQGMANGPSWLEWRRRMAATLLPLHSLAAAPGPSPFGAFIIAIVQIFSLLSTTILVWCELVGGMRCMVVVSLHTRIFFIQLANLLWFQRPACSRYLGHNLMIVLSAVLLDAVGIGRAVQHKGVHRPCDVSVLFLNLFKPSLN